MTSAAEYSNWVNELDSLKTNSTQLPPLSARSENKLPGKVRVAKPQSKSTAHELEQEMKLLRWHKLANEAALKAALIKTRKLKKEDIQVLDQAERAEKVEWMQQIIEEEQTKPMEVNSEFIRKYEQEERIEEHKKDAEVKRHITSLQNLKRTLRQREEMRQRQIRYREGKAALATKPTMAKPAKTKQSANQIESKANQLSGAPTGNKGTLSKVMNSLDKLVELEKRITDLENDSYSSISSATPQSRQTGQSSRQSIDNTPSRMRFVKKKSAISSNAASSTTYSISRRPIKPSNDRLISRPTRASQNRRSVNATRVSGNRKNKTQTFITSIPEKRKTARVSTHRMTSQQKRHVQKLEKQRVQKREIKRQEKIVNNWLEKKKKAAATTSRRVPSKTVTRAKVGAASGRTTSNRHLQEFKDLRRDFDRKRGKPNTTRQPGSTRSTVSRISSVSKRTAAAATTVRRPKANNRALPDIRTSRSKVANPTRRRVESKPDPLPKLGIMGKAPLRGSRLR